MDIRSLYINELTEYCLENGYPKFRAKQIYEWLHKKHVSSAQDMNNIPKDIREKLDADIFSVKYVTHQTDPEDGTRKFLFEMEDGQMIETVFMRYEHGNSICISSQAGCAMGCKFCASTIGGCIRNLTAGEMLGQVYEAMNIVKKEVALTESSNTEVTSPKGSDKKGAEPKTNSSFHDKEKRKDVGEITNVVVMGTGEPFQNYDNLIRFIKIITDEAGYNLSVRNITVSSCGIVPNIKKLADEGLPVTFALSLHAPTDELRKTIMPIANQYTIEETLEATDYYFNKTGRRITIEYSLMSGINDSKMEAEMLGELLMAHNSRGNQHGIYHVNLIPINPVEERSFKANSSAGVADFKKILEKNRINVTIRRGMGRNIDAACGQLRRKYGL